MAKYCHAARIGCWQQARLSAFTVTVIYEHREEDASTSVAGERRERRLIPLVVRWFVYEYATIVGIVRR